MQVTQHLQARKCGPKKVIVKQHDSIKAICSCRRASLSRTSSLPLLIHPGDRRNVSGSFAGGGGQTGVCPNLSCSVPFSDLLPGLLPMCSSGFSSFLALLETYKKIPKRVCQELSCTKGKPPSLAKIICSQSAHCSCFTVATFPLAFAGPCLPSKTVASS